MIPVASSSFSDGGSPVAEKWIGRVPVQGMRNRNGCPGLAPYTFGPLIWGIGDALGVRISGRLCPNPTWHGSPRPKITIEAMWPTQPMARDMYSPVLTMEVHLHK